MFSLKNDFIFAFVFGMAKSERILKALTNDLLHLEGDDRIVELTLLNPINLKMNFNEKFTILDIKAVDGKKRRFNIEMQVAPDPDFVPRILFYHDRLFIEQLKSGKSYEELCPAISLSILDFILFQDEPDIQNIFKYLNVRAHRELSPLKVLHFIELPKFTVEKPRQLRTRFEKWLHVLKFSELYYEHPDSMPPELRQEEEIVMAMKSMHHVTRDELVIEAYRAREKAELDQISRLRSAEKKGLAEGRDEAQWRIARNLLKNAMPLEQISLVTGIPLDELKKGMVYPEGEETSPRKVREPARKRRPKG